MGFLVCYSKSPPDDHTRWDAVYLDQKFYELILTRCRKVGGPYVVLREIASLRYKSPTLVVSDQNLELLARELGRLADSGVSHPQIAKLQLVCFKAQSEGVALTISGDMYPEL